MTEEELAQLQRATQHVIDACGLLAALLLTASHQATVLPWRTLEAVPTPEPAS